ncbi:MAG: 30S ribosomal protein S20 [Candidatus Yanofskybacteria bacterium RIFCSPHIGHO2_01_FULL_44_17]|uniref:Small ribosomal subunit protein bS20 n=1 Tax=Candidatus Yanofskybacteria bacterium RIFCSPHIGHO2_01_FULL_44_17 TaxID=1802668 RepID=A0A1F8ETU3_9BACT|nr:MAG: 30S ribosomal protein S20 [Candidatus Yanofskybacteria bacterium RIFCSPHIGHO2_01_FULL_44_17]
MPITQSAKKALRQSKKKHAHNVRRKTKFRVFVKEFRKAVIAKNFDKAKEILPSVYKALDKAAKSKTIKKNTSSRLKSRLTRLINKNTQPKQ